MSVPAVADLAPALVIAEREHDIDALRAPHSAGAVLAKCPNMFAQVGVDPPLRFGEGLGHQARNIFYEVRGFSFYVLWLSSMKSKGHSR